ncbi:hypothetical protein [Salmonella sp. s55004]|uniref:hypothetical protein n=1 Tax=Salmonella sp. s55004 TaxID=3159675 RepID=UPI003980612B
MLAHKVYKDLLGFRVRLVLMVIQVPMVQKETGVIKVQLDPAVSEEEQVQLAHLVV